MYYFILFSGFVGEARHEGIFTFAIVLLVICICVIIMICLCPWYYRRRREKQEARFAKFSWTDGVDILEENDPVLLPSSIIKSETNDYQDIKKKEEKFDEMIENSVI